MTHASKLQHGVDGLGGVLEVEQWGDEVVGEELGGMAWIWKGGGLVVSSRGCVCVWGGSHHG